jgi:hypothetical protein
MGDAIAEISLFVRRNGVLVLSILCVDFTQNDVAAIGEEER